MQTLMNLPQLTNRRKQLRNQLTPAEATLWKVLKGKSMAGYKFRRQHSVGPYILDFYCPQLKLAIELDGEVHTFKEDYDERRTYFLSKTKGITVLRFENRDVFENMRQIIEEIGEYASGFSKREDLPPRPLGTPPPGRRGAVDSTANE